MDRQNFFLGDLVTWRSQSQGSTKGKSGRIVEVVPPHRYPSDEWASGIRVYGPFRKSDGKPFSLTRDHESYIVEVSAGERARKRYYWPVVSGLRKVA
jgi:hypothetical protein